LTYSRRYHTTPTADAARQIAKLHVLRNSNPVVIMKTQYFDLKEGFADWLISKNKT
jgi:hypothetical protein